MANKGNVKSINVEENSILLERDGAEEWIALAPNVKSNFIKVGEVEYNTIMEQDQEYVSFVKALKTPFQSGNGGFPKPHTVKPEDAFKKSSIDSVSKESMNNMCALKYASSVYGNSSNAEEFKKLSTEILIFLQSGAW